MFQEWGFLLTEIWVLLVLAALVGLIAGWLIWGGRADTRANADEVRRLKAELERASAKAKARDAEVDLPYDTPDMQAVGYVRPEKKPAAESIKTPSQTPAKPVAAAKPEGLETPRNGIPDDLTTIKGIGAKMEKLCNRLGFWHFDQIAAWSADEIAWVDENLEGFKGRVTRDNWVAQAKALSKN